MNMTTFAGAICAIAVSFPLYAEQREGLPEGKKLFQKYGCTNCHGANGVNPTSKHVPVLRGKSADYIVENATAIFGGKEKSDETHFMHEQFCIGEVKEEGCYPPPTRAELRVIANWLSGEGTLAEPKKTPQGLYVTALEAYQRMQDLGSKALFIDVRTRAEVAFLGMPTVADANIPYMVPDFEQWDAKKNNFKMQPNSAFTMHLQELVTKRGLTKDSPIFLMCRSGNRSAKAANLLRLAGYTQVYTVTDGFEGDKAKHGPNKGQRVVNGWKNEGLPWSYKLQRDAMYSEM
jgi:rhodanese-related sulfurtransferase